MKKQVAQNKEANSLSRFFSHFSAGITKATGGVYAFIIAVTVIIIWAVSGPFFNYSNSWQLVINTGTTIITFLMVFVIQHSQNKDTIALQVKLDELIATSHASNKLISVEDLTDEELEVIKKFYIHLSGVTRKEKENKIHSLEEKKEMIDENLKELNKNSRQ